jgi:hypothetical protein
VSREVSFALFGNLESLTLEVQFLVTIVGFAFSWLIAGCTDLLELSQPELFAKNTQGDTVLSVKVSACLLDCAIIEYCIIVSSSQIRSELKKTIRAVSIKNK